MDEAGQLYGFDRLVVRALHLSRPNVTACCQRMPARLDGLMSQPM
jgi:hypothetical protein